VGATSKVRLAPALVLRRRDHTAVIDYYDAMLTELTGHGADVPTGLARFVTGQAQRNLAYVPDRSPQSIADLLVALLARGRRVLVTGSAAAELTAALPAEVAPLCATSATVRQSLSALAARFRRVRPGTASQVLAEQESRLATMQGIERDLREQVEFAAGAGDVRSRTRLHRHAGRAHPAGDRAGGHILMAAARRADAGYPPADRR